MVGLMRISSMHNYMKPVYSIVLLTIVTIALLGITTVNGLAYSSDKSFDINLSTDYSGWVKLKHVRFSITNNTNLSLSLVFDGVLPTGVNKGYEIIRYIYARVDADNNPLTGSIFGEEAYYYAIVNSFNFQTVLYEYTYLKNGTLINRRTITNYMTLDKNTSSINISIPLTQLNLTSDNVFAIVDFDHQTRFYDNLDATNFPTKFNNVSIPIATINVDGDPSDWDGINPIAVDSKDPFTIPYQEFNLTAFYMAIDDEYMYFRFDFGDKFIGKEYSSPVSNGFSSIYLQLDVDNNGVPDYYLTLYRNSTSIRVFNNNEKSWNYYSTYRGEYQAAESGNGIAEYAIPLKYIGINNTSSKVSIVFYSLQAAIAEHPVGSYYTSNVEPRYTTDRIIHLRGNNWSFSSVEGQKTGIYEVGEQTATLSSLTMDLKLTNETGYAILRLIGDPTGKAAFKHLSEFYAIRINSSEDIEGPIRFSYKYTDEILREAGISADYLKPYVYDWNTGNYLPVENLYNNPSMKILTFTINPIDYSNMRYIVIGFFESNETTSGNKTTTTTTHTITSTNTITNTVTETVTSTLNNTVTVQSTTTLPPITATITRNHTNTITSTTTLTKTLTETSTIKITTTLPGETITKTLLYTTTTIKPTQTVVTETITKEASLNQSLFYALIIVILILVAITIVTILKKR